MNMRGHDKQQSDMFSYLSPEVRVRKDHPLRAIRTMADHALENMSRRFDAMYAKTGRPSIPPEKLLRAQLIQMLYSVRSERLLGSTAVRDRWSSGGPAEEKSCDRWPPLAFGVRAFCHPLRRFLRWSSAAPAVAQPVGAQSAEPLS